MLRQAWRLGLGRQGLLALGSGGGTRAGALGGASRGFGAHSEEEEPLEGGALGLAALLEACAFGALLAAASALGWKGPSAAPGTSGQQSAGAIYTAHPPPPAHAPHAALQSPSSTRTSCSTPSGCKSTRRTRTTAASSPTSPSPSPRPSAGCVRSSYLSSLAPCCAFLSCAVARICSTEKLLQNSAAQGASGPCV